MQQVEILKKQKYVMCLLFCERSDIALQRCSEIFKHLTELVTSRVSLCSMEQKICHYIHSTYPDRYEYQLNIGWGSFENYVIKLYSFFFVKARKKRKYFFFFLRKKISINNAVVVILTILWGHKLGFMWHKFQ